MDPFSLDHISSCSSIPSTCHRLCRNDRQVFRMPPTR
jgi:hypothetical protein